MTDKWRFGEVRIMNKSLEYKAECTLRGVQYRARKHFRLENFSNPYGDRRLIQDYLIMAMATAYDLEIQKLITERICPCCGQYTRGDIDF